MWLELSVARAEQEAWEGAAQPLTTWPTGDGPVSQGPGSQGEDGVHDGQVPVDAHECDEEDAAVEAH